MSNRLYTHGNYAGFGKGIKQFDLHKDCISRAFPGKTSKGKRFDKLDHKERHQPYLNYHTDKTGAKS